MSSATPSDHNNNVVTASSASQYTIRLRPRKTLLETIAVDQAIVPTTTTTSQHATTNTNTTTTTTTSASTGSKRPRTTPAKKSPTSADDGAAATNLEDVDVYAALEAAGSAASQQELFKIVETTAPWIAASSFLQTVLEAYVPLGGEAPLTPTTGESASSAPFGSHPPSTSSSSLTAALASCEQVCTLVRALTDSGYAPVLYTHVVTKLRLHAAAAVARLIAQAKALNSAKKGRDAVAVQDTVQLLCAEAAKELCALVERSPSSAKMPSVTAESAKKAASPITSLEQFISSEMKRANSTTSDSTTSTSSSSSSEQHNQQSLAAAMNATGEELVAASPEIALLRAAVRMWDRWASVLTLVSDVFMYLGRRYVLLETSEGSIMQLGVKILEEELESSKAKARVFDPASSAFASLLLADHHMAASLIGTGKTPLPPSTASMETKSIALQIGAWCLSNDQRRILGSRGSRGSGGFRGNGNTNTILSSASASAAPHFATLRVLVAELLSYRDFTTSVSLYVPSLHPRVVTALSTMYDQYGAWLVSEASPAEALLSISGIPPRTFNHASTTNNNSSSLRTSTVVSAASSSRVSPTTTGPKSSSTTATDAASNYESMTVLEMLNNLIAPAADALQATAPTTTASDTTTASSPSSSSPKLTPNVIVECIRSRVPKRSSTQIAMSGGSTYTVGAAVFFHCTHHLVNRERRRAVVFLNNSSSAVSGSSEMVEELVQKHAIKPFVGLLFQRDFHDLVVEGITLETQGYYTNNNHTTTKMAAAATKSTAAAEEESHHEDASASPCSSPVTAELSSSFARVPTGLNAVALGFHLLCMRYVRQKDVAKDTFHSFIESAAGWYMLAASLLGDEAGGSGSGMPSSSSPEAVAIQLKIMKDFTEVLGEALTTSSLSTSSSGLLEQIDVIEATFLSSELASSFTRPSSSANVYRSVTLKKVAYLKSYTRLLRQQSLVSIAKEALERQFPVAGAASTSTTLAARGGTTSSGLAEEEDSAAAAAATTTTADSAGGPTNPCALQTKFAAVLAAAAFRRHVNTFSEIVPPTTTAAPNGSPSSSALAEASSEEDELMPSPSNENKKRLNTWLARMGIAPTTTTQDNSSVIDFGCLIQGERGWGCGGGLHPSPIVELPTLIPDHLVTNLVALRQSCDTIVRRCFLGEVAVPQTAALPPASSAITTTIAVAGGNHNNNSEDSTAPIPLSSFSVITSSPSSITQHQTASESTVVPSTTPSTDVDHTVAIPGDPSHSHPSSPFSPLAQAVIGFSTGTFSETAKLMAANAFRRSAKHHHHNHHHSKTSLAPPQQQVTAGFYAAEFTRAIRVGFERGFNRYAPCDDGDSSDEDDGTERPAVGASGATMETAFGLIGGGVSKKVTSTTTSSSSLAAWATKLERFHTYLQYQRPLELRGEVVPELLAQHIDKLMRTLNTSVATHMVALANITSSSSGGGDADASRTVISNGGITIASLMDASGLEVRDRVQSGMINKGSGSVGSAVAVAKRDIDRALTLFDYLPSKDVFEALYVRDFSKRALGFVQDCVLSMSEAAASGKSTVGGTGAVDVSSFVALERHAIRQLRLVCGTALTSKLEGMLKDLTDGFGKVNDAFADWSSINNHKAATNSESAEVEEEGGMESSGATTNQQIRAAINTSTTTDSTSSAAAVASGVFFVLSQSFWPYADTFTPNPKALPPAISKELDAFKTFFSTHRKSCALRWVPTLSECVVGFKSSSIGGDTIDLHMSLLQGLILTSCFNADIVNTSSSSSSTPKMVTVDDIVKAVCEMEEEPTSTTTTAPSSGLAIPVASSVGITVSSSGATLSKVESRRANARSKSLTRQQQAVLANIQCALVSLAASEVGILTPIFAANSSDNNTPVASTALYPLLGGIIQGFAFNPDAPILSTSSNISPTASSAGTGTVTNATAATTTTTRYVAQLVVSNLGTSAYASAASSQPLSGSHAVVRQQILSRAAAPSLPLSDVDESLSVQQVCDLKWTACLKYLNAEVLHSASHPMTAPGLLQLLHPTTVASNNKGVKTSTTADTNTNSKDISRIHSQVTMQLLNSLGDWLDAQESAVGAEKRRQTIEGEINTFVPVYFSKAGLSMAETMFELGGFQSVRCILHPNEYNTADKTATASTTTASMMRMLSTPTFIKAYPHLVKHVVVSAGGVKVGGAGSNASPHRDSSSRIAKSVALQRPYIIDVAVVQVLKSAGKLSFKELLNQVHTTPAVANKFEVAAPLLRARLTQLKARGVISLQGEEDPAAADPMANLVVEYKA